MKKILCHRLQATKTISNNNMEIKNIIDFISDHIPIPMTFIYLTIRKRSKFTNKYTDWHIFRNDQTNLKRNLKLLKTLIINLKTFLMTIITLRLFLLQHQKNRRIQEICYNLEVREMIIARRETRRICH